MEEGLFPHSRSAEDDDELEEERRLFYVGMTRAERRLFLTSAARRRVFGEYQATEPSRFLDEVPAELVERITPALNPGHHGNFAHAHYEFRTNPYSRGGRAGAQFKEDSPKYAYEDEDQSATGVRAGMRVSTRSSASGSCSPSRSTRTIQDHRPLQQRRAEEAAAKFAKLEPA